MTWWEKTESEEDKKQSNGTLIGFDKLYPEREGYVFVSRRGEASHVGYLSMKTRRCVCHTHPVFEQYIMDYDENGQRNVPAKEFVAICPKCEIRAKGHGDLDWCMKQWNSGKFQRDMVMVRYKPKDPDPVGIEMLSRKVVAGAVEEAVDAVKRKHDLTRRLNNKFTDDGTREVLYTQLQLVRSALKELNEFITKSPLLWEFDDEAVLSGIRKQVYPDLKPEERIKIPLNLMKM